MCRIWNFDKTCLSFDGSNTNCSGRLDCVIYDPRFPVFGIAMTKTSLMATLIAGSTTAGEVFPPHIQFQLKAKSGDTAQIHIDAAEHIQHVLGKFGCKEVKPWPTTFGMNKKGGMDHEEFAKYMQCSIAPLFPDALDQPGCCVLLKVISGPSKINLQLLASLKLLDIVLYPCIPNTTHVTQETDQLYGPFKTQFLTNLDLITEARLDSNKSLLLAPKMVGLPLFGGIDQETGLKVETGAFQKAFVPLLCIQRWEKVKLAPNSILELDPFLPNQAPLT
jgi:hypothetical protein